VNLRAVLLALVFASLAGTLTVLYLRKVEVETSGGTPVRVLVAVRPLEVGMLVTDDALTTRSIPQAWVETRAVRETDRQRILGLKVEIAVKPQQTVLWTDLAITTGGERNLSDLIQPGMRAIGLRGGAEDQSFALVRPGDRVDVFATIPQPKDDTQRSSITLAQNLLVLAVGMDTGGEAVGPRSPDRRDTVLTVSAAALQIQQISLATDRGKLSIAIKPRRGDDNYDATELTMQSLLTPPAAKPVVVAKALGPKALLGGAPE
jgi:pilus assembly protein CpaB